MQRAAARAARMQAHAGSCDMTHAASTISESAHPLSAQKKSQVSSDSLSCQPSRALSTSYMVFFRLERHRMGPLVEGAGQVLVLSE